MKIAAVIVNRKGSLRIKSKAWQKINGISLIERKISQLKKIKGLNNIYVGTNDLRIKKLCKKYNVNFVKRENFYCDEKKCTANEMIKNMLSFVNADYVLWAHLTNPFISTKNYEEAIKLFIKNKKKFNSLFSTTIVKNHFWSNKKKPINHNPFSKKHIVAAKLEPVFFQNGGIFIRKKNEMKKDGRFIGSKPLMFAMDELTGWDLDYEWQMNVARHLKNKKYVY